eukprot:scaffold20342_cov90-Skeletonema_marinoi.AAC.2
MEHSGQLSGDQSPEVTSEVIFLCLLQHDSLHLEDECWVVLSLLRPSEYKGEAALLSTDAVGC